MLALVCEVVDIGADVIVVGSAVFGEENTVAENVSAFRSAVE